MKALLLKDYYTIKKQLNWVFLILVIFTVITILSGNSMILITLGIVFGTVQVSTLFSFDEMSKWDRFANTLPVKKEQIILSKYMISIFLSIGIMVVIFTIVFIQNMLGTDKIPSNSMLAIFCFLISCTILISCFTLPFYVKFGSQKGKFAILVFGFIPVFLIGFFGSEIENIGDILPSIETLHKIAYVSPIISFILLVVSYNLSVGFYKKKEF